MIESFSEDIREISNHLKNRGYYSMEVTVTDECNLRCSYCFEGDECLKTTTLECVDEIFDAIDKMLGDPWFMYTFTGIHMGFWGGEPTLRPDILKRFADKYCENEFISFHIYTNGVIINGIMDAFDSHKDKIGIQVSYDGKKINDIKRLTKFNTPSTEVVRKNIYKLVESGYNVTLKSTGTYDVIEYMVDCWDDIKTINDDLGEKIKYSITLDYVNPVGINIKDVRKSFIALAKRELVFYKEKGYHLFSWFESTEPLTCGFFKSGMAINTTGDLMYCHGCGYSPNIDNLIFGNIRDEDFLDKIKYNNTHFNKPQIKECDDCYATNCITCNVVKYDNSTKDDFYERWYDLPCQKDHCEVFKEFSKISISLKDILKEV